MKRTILSVALLAVVGSASALKYDSCASNDAEAFQKYVVAIDDPAPAAECDTRAPMAEYKACMDAARSAQTKAAADRENAAKRAAGARAKAQAAKGGVSLGMTPDQVRASSWGKPQSINRTTTASGTREQWVYGGKNYLYFESGKLTAIQN